MATRLNVDTRSVQGLTGNTRGNALTASLEAGIPLVLNNSLVLEPQAQLVWQNTSLKDFNDVVSNVFFERDKAVTARLGVRLRGALDSSANWKPYLLANLWHSVKGNNGLVFAGADTIKTSGKTTALELGVGVSAQINAKLTMYGRLSRLANLGGAKRRAGQAQVGLQYLW